jgi:hypothetical protein
VCGGAVVHTPSGRCEAGKMCMCSLGRTGSNNQLWQKQPARPVVAASAALVYPSSLPTSMSQNTSTKPCSHLKGMHTLHTPFAPSSSLPPYKLSPLLAHPSLPPPLPLSRPPPLPTPLPPSPCRPLHPRYASGCGMVACSGPDELVTLGAMRKALAPYMYSEGIHAFACLDQMRAARTQAVAS